MTYKIFSNIESDGDKLDLDELTSGDLHDITKPIKLSDNIKSILNSKLGLVVVNHESKAVRIVSVETENIIKIVIYLKDPMPFVKNITKFYKKNNIEIVFTTGICFRGKHLEDCLYESYLNLDNAKDLTPVKIIEELEKIEGVEKIFIIPVELQKQNGR